MSIVNTNIAGIKMSPAVLRDASADAGLSAVWTEEKLGKEKQKLRKKQLSQEMKPYVWIFLGGLVLYAFVR